MRKVIKDKRGQQDLDIQRKVNHPSKEHKRIKDLLAIIVVSYVIHQIDVGAMEKQNSMENAAIVISMVIGKMSAKRNPSLKESTMNFNIYHFNKKTSLISSLMKIRKS